MLHEYIEEQILKIVNVVHDMIEYTVPIEVNEGIAIGAGDSFAVALALQYLTKFRIRAVDPRTAKSLYRNGDSGEYVIAISYRGLTKSVLNAADILGKHGYRVVALTSNPKSPIIKIAKYKVIVPRVNESLPIGISSFVSMLTAGLKLVGSSVKNIDIQHIENFINEVLHKDVNISPKLINEVVIVGDGVGIASSYYTCLKFYEALCMPCRSYPIEELLHAAAFSINERSLLISYTGNRDITKVLEDISKFLVTYYMPVIAGNDVAGMFKYVISGLITIRDISKKLNLKLPCFTSKKVLMNKLTDVIYLSIE